MADFPNQDSFWNLLNADTMGSDSTSNSQFPGFSSQAPMTPEPQAFLQTQQEAFIAFQQNFQKYKQTHHNSQSSNSFSQQTDSQPKRSRLKHMAKKSKGKEAEPTGDVTLRWSSDEEALLAESSTGGSQSSQFGEFVSHELRLKREAAEKAFEASKDKEETVKSLEELRFLALSTKDLSDDDAYWIERKKAQIKAKLRAEMPMEPNNEDDSDEKFFLIKFECFIFNFKSDEKNSGSQKVVLLSYGYLGFFGCECEKADVVAQNLVLPSYGTLPLRLDGIRVTNSLDTSASHQLSLSKYNSTFNHNKNSHYH
nr:hypothetical protein [Tanacetum cinerariifolium]